MVRSHEVAGPSNSKNLYGQMASILGCFQLQIPQNVATSMPSFTSQSCSDSLPAVCLAGQVGAIYRPPEHLCMRYRPMNETSVKVDC